MTMHFSAIADHAARDGAITADEIASLRKAGWSDGRISVEEAEAIFAINNALSEPTTEWSDFFVEAIGEFVINRLEPKGYVTPQQADWLIAQIAISGDVDSLTELEVLVRVAEKATSVPASLRAHVLEQIEHAVVTGEGPTRCGGELQAGNVTEAEERLLRRTLYGIGSERPAGISRREAELLFRIKDATLGAENAPAWKRLFVQGVGNYLGGFTAHTPVSRERAAELEAFMSDTSTSIGRFFGRLATDRVGANRFGMVFGRKGEPARDFAAEAATEAEVTGAEKAWLDEKVFANGRVDEYDRALLDFLYEDKRFV
jgi:hypothetical protein